jgi:hypothetical protein
MDQGHCDHPVLALFVEIFRFPISNVVGLKIQETRNNLQVVLDTVMDFT